jgi:hypothetical protein
MRGPPCSAKKRHFAGFSGKNQKKPQKTCGNRGFSIDKRFRKPHGYRRQVLSDPREYWRFRSPGANSDPEVPTRGVFGRPETGNIKEEALWQQR